jgi:hypothetical protein
MEPDRSVWAPTRGLRRPWWESCVSLGEITGIADLSRLRDSRFLPYQRCLGDLGDYGVLVCTIREKMH